MSREPTQHTNMRLPVELVAWIDGRAESNGVTRTTQVTRMLEYSRKVVTESEKKAK